MVTVQSRLQCSLSGAVSDSGGIQQRNPTAVVMSATVLVALAAVLCLAEVTQCAVVVRSKRAFKSYGAFHPHDKRADGDTGTRLGNTDTGARRLQLLDTGRDLTVGEMVAEVSEDRELAQDFVEAFMDNDGDGMISARELLPPSP